MAQSASDEGVDMASGRMFRCGMLLLRSTWIGQSKGSVVLLSGIDQENLQLLLELIDLACILHRNVDVEVFHTRLGIVENSALDQVGLQTGVVVHDQFGSRGSQFRPRVHGRIWYRDLFETWELGQWEKVPH